MQMSRPASPVITLEPQTQNKVSKLTCNDVVYTHADLWFIGIAQAWCFQEQCKRVHAKHFLPDIAV